MMTLARFWRAVESLPGQAAVAAEWRRACGADWPWARALLRPTGELAACYPKLGDEPASPLAYDVVCHDAEADDYVGVCPDGTGRIALTRAQLLVYELDRRALAERVAAALGAVPDVAADDAAAPLAYRVGTYEPHGAGAVLVYLAFTGEPEQLERAVSSLAMRHAGPLSIFTPTRRGWRTWPDAFRERRGAVLASCDALRPGEAGRLVAADGTLPLLQRMAARRPLATRDEDGAPTFRREADGWRLWFEGRGAWAPDRKGLRYIAYLLGRPGLSHHAGELWAACGGPGAGEGTPVAATRGAPVFDGPAWSAARRRSAELAEELADARRAGNDAALEAAEKEVSALAEQVRGAAGKGGRNRRLGDDGERLRKAVCNAVDRALAEVRSRHEPLWRHLDAAIERGTFLRYDPAVQTAWQL